MGLLKRQSEVDKVRQNERKEGLAVRGRGKSSTKVEGVERKRVYGKVKSKRKKRGRPVPQYVLFFQVAPSSRAGGEIGNTRKTITRDRTKTTKIQTTTAEACPAPQMSAPIT